MICFHWNKDIKACQNILSCLNEGQEELLTTQLTHLRFKNVSKTSQKTLDNVLCNVYITFKWKTFFTL